MGEGREASGPRSDLVHEGLGLVAAVARRLARRMGGHVPVDDLRSIGNSALLEIVRTWDPARATFAAYATWRLKWAMLDGLRRETHGRWTAARATALLASERLADGYAEAESAARDAPPTTIEEDQASLGNLLGGHAAALAAGLLAADPDGEIAETPEEKVQWVEAAHVAKTIIAGLPGRERELMERYYYGGEPFAAIARDLGITKSWASRLNQRAIAVMQRAMGVPPLEGEQQAPIDE